MRDERDNLRAVVQAVLKHGYDPFDASNRSCAMEQKLRRALNG
jgi:hypothetical protein